jgi:erythromycin esterase
MKNKVDWILEREGGNLIFITGHNGHIEKTSASPGYTCMGERLAKDYGKAYFAIGTDVLETTFNAVTKSGKEKVITVKHKNVLTKQFAGLSSNINYLKFVKAEENSQLAQILNRRLAMVNIGAEFDSWQKISSFFYTLKIVPDRGFDGLIVLQNATPSQKTK